MGYKDVNEKLSKLVEHGSCGKISTNVLIEIQIDGGITLKQKLNSLHRQVTAISKE